MSLKATDLGCNYSEPKQHKVDFKKVVQQMRKQGSSAGFRSLRDFLLENYYSLKNEFGAANVIGLAINCDKHAIFADISASKSKEDANVKWKLFQDWLQGKSAAYVVDEDNKEEVDEPQAVVVSDAGTEAGDDGGSGDAD